MVCFANLDVVPKCPLNCAVWLTSSDSLTIICVSIAALECIQHLAGNCLDCENAFFNFALQQLFLFSAQQQSSPFGTQDQLIREDHYLHPSLLPLQPTAPPVGFYLTVTLHRSLRNDPSLVLAACATIIGSIITKIAIVSKTETERVICIFETVTIKHCYFRNCHSFSL